MLNSAAPQFRFSLPAVFIALSRRSQSALKHKQNGCQWQPWFHWGLVAHCYVGLSEGPTVILRLGARSTRSLTSELRLILEPKCLRTGLATAKEDLRDGMDSGQGHSNCLWLQIFGVKRDSLLPNGQRDYGNLSGQGEARHLWPHPFSYQSLIELLEWTLPGGGLDRRALE
jgi:hypothetical protein